MIVVDTNILIYAAIPGARSQVRELVFRRDPHWAAPLLWRSEFRNVLAGYWRRGELDAAQALEAVSLAASFLTAGEHSIRDEEVLALVEQSSCTAYDCEFLALALRLGVLLITDDRALLRAFPRDCKSSDEFLGGS